MTAEDAEAISIVLLRAYGHGASRFCERMVRHFETDNPAVAAVWRLILQFVPAARGDVVGGPDNGFDRRQSARNSHLDGQPRKP